MNRPVRATAPNEAAALLHSFTNHLLYSLAKDEYSATELDRFMSLALTVRDRLIERWIQHAAALLPARTPSASTTSRSSS